MTQRTVFLFISALGINLLLSGSAMAETTALTRTPRNNVAPHLQTPKVVALATKTTSTPMTAVPVSFAPPAHVDLITAQRQQLLSMRQAARNAAVRAATAGGDADTSRPASQAPVATPPVRRAASAENDVGTMAPTTVAIPPGTTPKKRTRPQAHEIQFVHAASPGDVVKALSAARSAVAAP